MHLLGFIIRTNRDIQESNIINETVILLKCGQGSSVSIVTDYGLDDP